MRERRAALVAEARDFWNTVEARCASENRAPTAEENGKFESIRRKVEGITDLIEETEGRSGSLTRLNSPDDLDTVAAELEQSRGRRSAPIGQNRSEPERRLYAEKWVERRTGEPVYVLGKEHKLADLQGRSEQLHMGRLIVGMASGNWDGAEAERRALSTLDPATAGYLVAPPMLTAGVIDLARSLSVVMRAGARIVPMSTKQLDMATLDSDPTAEWKQENHAFNDSTPTFGRISMFSHTMGTLVKLSRELASDSGNAAEVVQNAMAQALAAELDRAVLFGDGAGEPCGITNWPNVQAIAAVGLPTHDHFIDAWQKILEQNGDPARCAIVMAPREAGRFAKLKDGDGEPADWPPVLRDMPKLISTRIPTNLGGGGNESLMFLGDFSQVYVGVRQDVQLEMTREAGDAFVNHQVWLKATWRGDSALTYPKHFVQLTGVTVS